MSDFLTNLLARSAGATLATATKATSAPAVIQPRLPSLFETPAAAAGEGAPAVPPLMPGGVDAPERGAGPMHGSDSGTAPFPAENIPATGRATASSAAAEGNCKNGSSVTDADPANQAIHFKPAELPQQLPPPNTHHPAGSSALFSQSPQLPARDGLLMPGSGNASPPPGLRTSPMKAGADGGAAAAIRVTIGRIEVRAIGPAEPAAVPPGAGKRGKPQPRLTLDHYLSERRQGKR